MVEHFGTTQIPRKEVKPGTVIKHGGRVMVASANVAKGLYAFSLLEQTRITAEEVEVCLNYRGEPLIH
ncbi:hypothetical protein AFK67_12125 [Cronobacter dublinensis subsp. dublinensis LMG 23823]|nr:hypothetical protein AFK67_12125 [Cronobacter dublinensis subsp. dublinensis LMG 23823]